MQVERTHPAKNFGRWHEPDVWNQDIIDPYIVKNKKKNHPM